VNVAIAPDLVSEFGLNANQMGLVSSAYLLAFASSALGLLVGRGLIGIGVSACLMAAFTAYANLLPSQKLPLVNGLQLMSGGLGWFVRLRLCSGFLHGESGGFCFKA